MFSKSWGYAVRAMLRLAEIHDDPKARRMAGELAEETGMPPSFLSKVIQQLSAAGLVDSARGRQGGIRLARNPEEITLFDIAKVTDNFDKNGHDLSGFEDAPEMMKGILYKKWKPYHRGLVEFLAEINLASLVKELEMRRK
ncbi:MAG: Rrf2 family transcriptional regulator [Candidatus Electryonea clarkiae]|nr:Rrf2 family transcriptional regulator [Candidatus Electryonea clarkiae]MDP8285303.1 Rrf2 family transcriptional regulator [Candidatus Electryonea clarkiae]